MPSMASPFSRVGAGAACECCVSLVFWIKLKKISFFKSYLAAAVDGGVLANAVDLVAGRGVDNVVRLGSVARHDWRCVVVFGWCVW